MLLCQILAYTIHIEKSYKDNKSKISAPAWKEEFELPVGSYSMSDIEDFLEFKSSVSI